MTNTVYFWKVFFSLHIFFRGSYMRSRCRGLLRISDGKAESGMTWYVAAATILRQWLGYRLLLIWKEPHPPAATIRSPPVATHSFASNNIEIATSGISSQSRFSNSKTGIHTRSDAAHATLLPTRHNMSSGVATQNKHGDTFAAEQYWQCLQCLQESWLISRAIRHDEAGLKTPRTG